ncbi:MAG: hypothetical protein M1830_007598 [Pleopsidium flavum]|nr:MAG: hypothetical protein M1830_007598 [Pleopsidium flavum]
MADNQSSPTQRKEQEYLQPPVKRDEDTNRQSSRSQPLGLGTFTPSKSLRSKNTGKSKQFDPYPQNDWRRNIDQAWREKEVGITRFPGLVDQGESSQVGKQKARPGVPARATEQVAEADRCTEPGLSDAELTCRHWLFGSCSRKEQ